MTGDSASGGPLLPSAPSVPSPLEDVALTGFFQKLVADLSGMDETMIRPSWQATSPPPVTAIWAEVGIRNRQSSGFAYVDHLGDGDGADLMQRHEDFEVLCSFYGPGADNAAALVRDGLSIAQNREPLQRAEMGLIGVGEATAVPAVIGGESYYRLDMPIRVRRAVTRLYPVLNLMKVAGTIATPSNLSLSLNVEP